jgi:predicted Zn-dependent peptidase
MFLEETMHRPTGLFALAALASLASPAPAQNRPAKPVTVGSATSTNPSLPPISYTEFTLANGLRVILHEDHSTPIVAVNVWYHVGSKNEQPVKTGYAHLFEHMMFQGSKGYDDDYFKALQEIGGSLNGSTNTDRTNYWEVVPSNFLERAVFLEADSMATLPDVFFRRYYTPNNASLVIAGDFKPADARRYVEKYFAPIKRGPDVTLPVVPITQQELDQAKESLIRGFPRTFETPAQIATRLTDVALYGLPDNYFNTYIAGVRKVTAADVTRVANAAVDPSHLAILVVGDRNTVEAGLRSLEGIGATVTVLDADGRPVVEGAAQPPGNR